MIFFVSVSIPLGFCNPIIPILDIGYTPFDHFYIWAIDHLLNGMHTTTTTCSVSRCHPPHRPNHLAWQWTIWTMDGFEKKKLQETMGFTIQWMGFPATFPYFSHQSVLGKGQFWWGVSAVGLLAGSAIVAAPVHVMLGVGLPVSAAAGLKGPVNSVLRLFWSWNEIQQNQLLHRWVLNSWCGG